MLSIDPTLPLVSMSGPEQSVATTTFEDLTNLWGGTGYETLGLSSNDQTTLTAEELQESWCVGDEWIENDVQEASPKDVDVRDESQNDSNKSYKVPVMELSAENLLKSQSRSINPIRVWFSVSGRMTCYNMTYRFRRPPNSARNPIIQEARTMKQLLKLVEKIVQVARKNAGKLGQPYVLTSNNLSRSCYRFQSYRGGEKSTKQVGCKLGGSQGNLTRLGVGEEQFYTSRYGCRL
jgi:hypothetical protein